MSSYVPGTVLFQIVWKHRGTRQSSCSHGTYLWMKEEDSKQINKKYTDSLSAIKKVKQTSGQAALDKLK